MLTVHELRRRGYKVSVHHNRLLMLNNKLDGPTAEVWSKGGSTEVVVTTPGDFPERSVVGVAKCSLKENFNRKRGVRIALGRALKQLGLCTK